MNCPPSPTFADYIGDSQESPRRPNARTYTFGSSVCVCSLVRSTGGSIVSRKKTARIFLSKEEKRAVTEGDPWDSVIEEIQRENKQPPLLELDALSSSSKRRWVLMQLCLRQNWKCFWCGRTMTDGGVGAPTYRTLEHVVPKATKGKNIDRLPNLRAACRECNEKRSIWSQGKSMSLTIENQKQIISQLQTDKSDLNTALVLADRCWLCRFRAWIKKIFRRESR